MRREKGDVAGLQVIRNFKSLHYNSLGQVTPMYNNAKNDVIDQKIT